MKHLLSIFLLFCTLGLSAQVDNPTGGIAIPKSNNTINPTPDPVTTETPAPLAPPKRSFSSYDLEKKENNFSMIKNDGFVSRAAEYEDKVNASVQDKGESNEAFRGNQFFGEVRSKSQFIQVLARDFEYADGDRIKVSVNDVVIVPEIILTNDFKGVQLTLAPGFNKIDFEALNQGTSGPNTAEFRVYDDKDEVISSNQWNLATGFKATVIVIKE